MMISDEDAGDFASPGRPPPPELAQPPEAEPPEAGPPEAGPPPRGSLQDAAPISDLDYDDDPPTTVANKVDLASLAGTLALSPEERDHEIPHDDPPTEETSEPSPLLRQTQVSNGADSQRAAATQVVSKSDPGELLPGAPAAVQAAAKQVLEAHRMGGSASVELSSSAVKSAPPLPPPPRSHPPPKPSRPESSPPRGPGQMTTVLQSGMVVNARYRVERLMGRGGMGTVYAVRHANTDEKLALKLLHPALAENEAAVSRFRTEARAPVRIESEHVVRVVDADVAEEIGRVPYIVMERLKGHDLRSELKRRGALPAGEVVLYLGQVARALDKAHNLGIVHRDMKPANLYIQRREDGSPLVKVLDFGIAKLTDDAAKELTVAGQVFGTPWYMAPEQARGDLGQVGPQTDLWALGLIAFQLLTGQNYWTADGMAALVGQICYEPMPPPTQRAPHLGPLFDMWFARACHRDPAQRFPTARTMIGELAQALGVNQSQGITTGEGQGRHMDSSLQIGGYSSSGHPMSQPPPGVSWSGPPAGHSMPPNSGEPYQPSHPSAPYQVPEPSAQYSIPGTALAASHPFDSTNAPLYTTHLPEGGPKPGKSNGSLPVILGVVIALLVAATGVGVYLSLPSDPVTTSAAGAPSVSPPPAPVAPEPAAVDEEPPPEPSPDDLEEEDPDEAVADEEPQVDEEPEAPEPKTATGPKPPSTPRPPSPPPPPTPRPKAPKVGKIKF